MLRVPAPPPLVALLAALLLVDALLVLAHLQGVGASAGAWSAWGASWRLDTERGAAELVQYGKFALAAAAFLLARHPVGRAARLAWAGVLTGLLIVDAFEVHERAGAVFGPALAARAPALLTSWARPADAVELATAIVLASAAGAVLLWAWRRDPRAGRGAWFVPLAALALLFGAGAVGDALHARSNAGEVRDALAWGADRARTAPLQATDWTAAIRARASAAAGRDTAWTIVEEGGELAAMSLLAAWACTRGARRLTPPAPPAGHRR